MPFRGGNLAIDNSAFGKMVARSKTPSAGICQLNQAISISKSQTVTPEPRKLACKTTQNNVMPLSQNGSLLTWFRSCVCSHSQL